MKLFSNTTCFLTVDRLISQATTRVESPTVRMGPTMAGELDMCGFSREKQLAGSAEDIVRRPASETFSFIAPHFSKLCKMVSGSR